MNIINPNDFQTKGKRLGKKILILSASKISISRETASFFHKTFENAADKEICAFEIGTDSLGQLHIKASDSNSLTAAIFRNNKNRFECGNTGLSKHLKKMHPTNSDKATVHFLITDAVNEEGWYPVITNYK